MMSNMQALMQVFTESALEPAALVTRLNRHIAARCPGNRFITMFYGVLDPRTGILVYCNAGHNPPVLVKAEGKRELLAGGGMILGIYGGAVFENQIAHLNSGDVLAMFSDGVTEACAPNTETEFGEDRLGDLVSANVGQNSSFLVDSVITELSKWTEGGGFADDVTLVIAKRL
jgi:phosphoserine phosphatase RsbU/P